MLDVPMRSAGMAARLYLLAARSSAALLGRHEVVHQVLVHRSVATGEVDFGRSDIDLILIVSPDPDGRRHGVQLLDLCRSVRRIRRVNRALNHVEAHDRPGWVEWLSLDTYRGSQERRSAITLSGPPAVLPTIPVRREHAVRRFVMSPLHYLVDVLVRGDRRNLRKIALDMWNAYAVATGSIPDPFLRREEIADHYDRSPERQQLGELGHAPETLMAFMWGLARLLHGRVLAPLGEFRQRLTVALRVPPYQGARRFVLPTASPGDQPQAQLHSTILSPEALDLFIHFVNPFVWHSLPADLLENGFRQPSTEFYVEASRYEFRGQILRAPGLMSTNTDRAIAWECLVRSVLPQLENGERPSAHAFSLYAARRPTQQEYYLEHFPRLRFAHDEITQRLRGLPGFEQVRG